MKGVVSMLEGEEEDWSDESSDEEDFNPFAPMVAAPRPPSPLRVRLEPQAPAVLAEGGEFLLGMDEYLQWGAEVLSEDFVLEMNDWVRHPRCPGASETLSSRDQILLRKKAHLSNDWGYHAEAGSHERFEEFTHGSTPGLLLSQEVSDLLFRNLEKIDIHPQRTTFFFTDTHQKLDRAIDFLASLEKHPSELLQVQRLWSAFLAEARHLPDLMELAAVPLESASVPMAFLVVAARAIILLCFYPCASEQCVRQARLVLEHFRECLD